MNGGVRAARGRAPRRALAAVATVALGLGGCEPDPTQALVTIDAPEELRPAITRLCIRVLVPAADGGIDVVTQEPLNPAPPFPWVVSLIPLGGDARRTWTVEAQADGIGRPAVTSVTGGYLPGAVTRFDLTLEPCPSGCTGAQHCSDGRCVDGPTPCDAPDP